MGTIEVDAREAPRRIVHARLSYPAGPGAFALVYPKWLPGEHAPTGPINDLVGLEMGARTGFNPRASVSLWQKMARAVRSTWGASSARCPHHYAARCMPAIAAARFRGVAASATSTDIT